MKKNSKNFVSSPLGVSMQGSYFHSQKSYDVNDASSSNGPVSSELDFFGIRSYRSMRGFYTPQNFSPEKYRACS